MLEKSDRKREYQQYDIKVERCRIDYASGTVTYFPSREDSYDRLLEENMQFAVDAQSVDDAAIKTVMIEKMLTCLKQLTCAFSVFLILAAYCTFYGKAKKE